MKTEDQLVQEEDSIIRAYLGLLQHQAKLQGKSHNGRTFINYFVIPDLLIQHLHPTTHEREILFAGVPVLRLWRTTTRREVSVHSKFIVQDWQEFS